MNHTFHAVHYSHPRPPCLFRFATAEDREAWITDHPGMRRAIAAPADQSGYFYGPVTVAGQQVSAGFRVAGLDDLFPPVTELRDRMIDRLKGAAVSP